MKVYNSKNMEIINGEIKQKKGVPQYERNAETV